MLYSSYRGLLLAVVPSAGGNEGNASDEIIGKAISSNYDLRYYLNDPPLYSGFIQGVDKKEEEYRLTHQELLPECPYVWTSLEQARYTYWDGEKATRLFACAPNEDDEYLTSIGAVKLSGEEKNEADCSLWYFSSDDPAPEYFSTCPYLWEDVLTEEDFEYPDDYYETDEDDDYDDHDYSTDGDPSEEDYSRYDVSSALEDPFEDAETAQDYYDDLVDDKPVY